MKRTLSAHTKRIGFALSFLAVTCAWGQPELEWARQYVRPPLFYPFDVMWDEYGNILVSGDLQGPTSMDMFVMRLDGDGDSISLSLYGLPDQDEEGGAFLRKAVGGGYAIAGPTTTSNRRKDFLLIRLDENGVVQWERTYGGFENSEDFGGFAATRDGGFVLAGDSYWGHWPMVLRVDANGDTLWQRDYPFTTNGMAQAITQASDGSFAVTGFASVENHSIQTFFARIDSLGTLIELRYYGGETTDYGRDIITVREGGYFIVSSSSSFSDHVWDIFALRLDADGDSLWGRIIDCGIFNWAERCKETVDGDFVIFGQCYEEGIYYTSLARVTESGEVLWQERHLVGDFFIYGGLDVDQHNRYLFCAKQTWDTALVMLTEPDSVYSAARIPSLPQHQSLVVEAFPNPFNSQITIRVRGVSTRGMQIELINVLGQVSNRVEIESNPTERAEFTLDGSLLPAGIYFVRASVGNRSAVSKIVLTK